MVKKINKVDKEVPEVIDPNEGQPVGAVENMDINALEIDMEHHVFIGGITQSGKSFFMKRLFDSIPNKPRRCIFFDYKSDPNHVKWIKQKGYPVFTTLEGIKRYWSKPRKFLNFSQKKISSKVIFRPKRPRGFGGAFQMLDDLAEYAFRQGNLILFIDEIAPLTSATRIPPGLYDCLIMGASRGITIVSVSQRPKDIHNIIMSESYTLVLFRLKIEDDRKKIEGQSSKEVANALKTIPNKQFIYVRADGDHQTCMLNAKKGEK